MSVHPVKLGGIHHVAYRCSDAKETVDWYGRMLGMRYVTAFAEDHVPSTGAYDPYMHVFLDAGNQKQDSVDADASFFFAKANRELRTRKFFLFQKEIGIRTGLQDD